MILTIQARRTCIFPTRMRRIAGSVSDGVVSASHPLLSPRSVSHLSESRRPVWRPARGLYSSLCIDRPSRICLWRNHNEYVNKQKITTLSASLPVLKPVFFDFESHFGRAIIFFYAFCPAKIIWV